jgi:hypothetical protein
MTGKPLAVTQKQVTAILKGAAKAGCICGSAREGHLHHGRGEWVALA